MNQHYQAKVDHTYRLDGKHKGDDVWSVRDWNGARIVWNLDRAEAERQSASLNDTAKLAVPVYVSHPSRWQDEWFHKYAITIILDASIPAGTIHMVSPDSGSHVTITNIGH